MFKLEIYLEAGENKNHLDGGWFNIYEGSKEDCKRIQSYGGGLHRITPIAMEDI